MGAYTRLCPAHIGWFPIRWVADRLGDRRVGQKAAKCILAERFLAGIQ
jgi:hypothetical protein